MKTLFNIKTTLAIVLLFAAAAYAQRPYGGRYLAEPTPVFLEGGWIVTSRDAKKYLDKNAAVFIDVRSSIEFERGHIPGAINVPFFPEYRDRHDFLPDEDMSKMWSLQFRKDKAILIYAERLNDWRGYYAAVSSIDNGFRNVMWLRNGFENWTDNKLPIEKGKK